MTRLIGNNFHFLSFSPQPLPLLLPVLLFLFYSKWRKEQNYEEKCLFIFLMKNTMKTIVIKIGKLIDEILLNLIIARGNAPIKAPGNRQWFYHYLVNQIQVNWYTEVNYWVDTTESNLLLFLRASVFVCVCLRRGGGLLLRLINWSDSNYSRAADEIVLDDFKTNDTADTNWSC